MLMYLPFGDWSEDGHRQSHNVLIEAPSMEHLLNAEKKIKADYGRYFFEDFANEYENPTLTDRVWTALVVTSYPIERLQRYEENNDWSDITDLRQVREIDPNPIVSLEFVEDAFVWLLNAYGAEIRICEREEYIPTICNWTCDGFETVGYGCFYC